MPKGRIDFKGASLYYQFDGKIRSGILNEILTNLIDVILRQF